MFISSMADRGATPALVKTLVFNQARLQVISENVANSSTPGYQAKQLDTAAFQSELRRALDARDHPSKPFVMRGRQVRTDDQGFLQVTPTREPVENVLFHDRTNLSIERQMADLAETGMTQEFAATLLRGYVDGFRKAIRGTV